MSKIFLCADLRNEAKRSKDLDNLKLAKSPSEGQGTYLYCWLCFGEFLSGKKKGNGVPQPLAHQLLSAWARHIFVTEKFVLYAAGSDESLVD